MKLTEFFRRRLEYEQKSKVRDLERLSMGTGVDDTPYYNKILEEMMIDFMDRLEAIEELLKPVPDDEQESKPSAQE